MVRVDIEAIAIDRINEKGQYEVEFDWACPKCEKTNRGHVESEHVISVVNVTCKKCRRPGYLVMPMLEEEVSQRAPSRKHCHQIVTMVP
jgi:hypothetical protein